MTPPSWKPEAPEPPKPDAWKLYRAALRDEQSRLTQFHSQVPWAFIWATVCVLGWMMAMVAWHDSTKRECAAYQYNDASDPGGTHGPNH